MMQTLIKLSLLTLTLTLAAQAHASVTLIETGFVTPAAQASAEDYQAVVNAAIATPAAGYGAVVVPEYTNISNHALFGSNTNIAFKSTVDFFVSAENVGTWGLRSGVDFGAGGALFLDGFALGFNSNDMWWNGSYTNPSQFFDYTLALGEGNHTLNLYGLEGCCDGAQQAQFKAPNAADFVNFAQNDGLTSPVPEPETYAMLGLGLGLLAWMRRRSVQTA